MAKEITPLAADGFLNPEFFIPLAREIDKVAAKEGLKPQEVYFTSKAVPKFDKAKAKAGGDAFTKKRAQPIKIKKRPPVAGARVKMVVHLRLYKGITDDEFGFAKDIKIAIRALEQHGKLAERTVEANKKAGAKIRERAAKEFDKNIEAVKDLLEEAGVDEDDVAIGQSMMGKTMIVRLPNGGYVSIGKSDEAKFNAAQSADDEDEDEKPQKKKKKKGSDEKPSKKLKKSKSRRDDDEDEAPKKKKKKKPRD